MAQRSYVLQYISKAAQSDASARPTIGTAVVLTLTWDTGTSRSMAATIKEFSEAPGYIVLKPRSSDPLHHPIVVHKQLVSRRVNEAATLPVVATSLASIEITTSRLLSCWVAGSSSQSHILQTKELRHGLPPQLRQASGSAPRWTTPISQRVDSPKFGQKIDTIVFRHGLQATTAATARVIELLRSEHDRRIHPHGPACRNPRRRDRDEAQRRDRRGL